MSEIGDRPTSHDEERRFGVIEDELGRSGRDRREDQEDQRGDPLAMIRLGAAST